MKTDQVKMKHFRKWAEGKNKFLAGLALNIVGFSKPCFKLFESVRKVKRIEGDIPLPRLKTWIKMYHNPKRIGKFMLNALGNLNDDTGKQANFLNELNEGAKQLKKMTSEQFKIEWKKITPHEWEKIIKENHRKMKDYLELAINDFVSEPTADDDKEFKKKMTKPEFIFFIRVLAPCFSLYGTYPLELLIKAQNGDNEALKKLIRLDKSIIFEPKISEIIHQAQAIKKQERMSMIKMAFTKTPKVTMNMKTIKCHFGGLISYLSIAINQKITAGEIRNLFDAISFDTNDDIDHDLGDMVGEPFEKAIQRSRNFWHIILPDKK